MKPFIQDADLTLYQGDVREVLRELEAESVHCVVTSPPYWGLRDYGAEGQLGLEPTPDLYVASMVEVFREVRRVLRRDGTCWLNMGDSYNAGTSAKRKASPDVDHGYWEQGGEMGDERVNAPGLKVKDLCMIPARLALALQADGWWLRSQIVWSKPNPMPESVTDRPTTSHEFVYLLAKQPRYFYDAEAVREPFSGGTHSRGSLAPRDMPKSAEMGQGIKNNKSMSAAIWGQAGKPPPQAETLGELEPEAPRGPDGRRQTHVEGREGSEQHRNGERWPGTARNLRSVWEIPTQPYPEAHFATYPEELVRRCILAGTSERGCCPECGGPWVRAVDTKRRYIVSEGGSHADGTYHVKYSEEPHSVGFHKRGGDSLSYNEQRWHNETTTVGWKPSCECADTNTGISVSPCTVLDPFFGSGTTGLVARKHGRRTIGIELSPEYCALAARRLSQLSLLSEASA